MTTAQPKGIDGTTVDTQRTIVLTGEHAQIAAAEVRYLAGHDFEDAPTVWHDLDGFTAAGLEQHVENHQAIVEHFAPALRQFEAQQVIDYNTARMTALARAVAAGEDDNDPAPDPPTTGDVTLTWSIAGLERLAQHLTGRSGFEATRGDWEEYDRRWPVGEAIREQLEDAA